MAYLGKTFTAIIPARGGSKGVPGKNTKLLDGRPLLSYALEAARESGVFNRIYVSTDSPKIADVARKLGADVLDRPAELASDTATTAAVIAYHCERLSPTDYVFILEPTNPLMDATDIRVCASNLAVFKSELVHTVVKAEGFSAPLGIGGSLRRWYPESLRQKRRQDAPPCYRIGGGIYGARWDIFAKEKDWYSNEILSYGVAMPLDHYDDIDTPADWRRVSRYMWWRRQFFLTWVLGWCIITGRVLRRIFVARR